MLLCDTGVLLAAGNVKDHHHAACVALMRAAERLNLTEVATVDRKHFSIVRPRHVSAFRLLP